MKRLLVASLILSLIASLLVFSHPQQAEATPKTYNVSSIAVPFSTYTRAGGSGSSFDTFIEAGYNGTISSIYQGRQSNNTLNYEVGNHPILPITLDTFANMTDSATTRATEKLNVTIASAPVNKALIVGITYELLATTNHNNGRIQSVSASGNTFSLLINKTVTCGVSVCDSEIWALGNNTSLSGFTTITITPKTVTTYHFVAGVYSVYNARSIRPLDNSATNTGTSVTPAVTITQGFQSGWMMDNILSLQTTTPSGNSDTREWVGKTSTLVGASQLKLVPTSGSNTLTWTTTNVQWVSTGVEIIPIQNQNNFGFNLAWSTRGQGTTPQNMPNNGSKIYYNGFPNTVNGIPVIQSFDVTTGVETHLFSGNTLCTANGGFNLYVYVSKASIDSYCVNGASTYRANTVANTTLAPGACCTVSTIKITGATQGYRYNTNSTINWDSTVTNTHACELNYMPTNTTITPIDDIACDAAIPDHATKFWHGMYLYKINSYYTTSTLPFFNIINGLDSKTRVALTFPNALYGITNPDVKLLGRWGGTNYMLSVNSATVQYISIPYMSTLLGQNRATQTYLLTLTTMTNSYEVQPVGSSLLKAIQVYGPGLNQSITTYGMNSLISGYTMKPTDAVSGNIRTIDPQWTNTPLINYPYFETQTSLFPIVLTVTDAPTSSAVRVQSQSQIINGTTTIWAVSQIDASQQVEFDIPPALCVDVYVADISVSPTIWNFEGSICATGTNTKTIAYTQTIPFTFYTMNYGATSTYTPSTNGLSTTVRATNFPFTYTATIKNSTGGITQIFTKTINGTIDTHTFNVTNATKPASLSISISGAGQIYSTYLGSPFSFASAASFFHQYFNYQGFDLLSFIPVIFASMFTRNTVGIGTAMVVVCIATLSWLSIVVIPENAIVLMIIVSIIGLIGYRGIYG